MTKSQLVERLAKAGGVTKKQAQALMDGLVSTVVGSVKKGEPVKIPDLGTFSTDPTSEMYEGGHAPPASILVPNATKWFDETLGPVQQ